MTDSELQRKVQIITQGCGVRLCDCEAKAQQPVESGWDWGPFLHPKVPFTPREWWEPLSTLRPKPLIKLTFSQSAAANKRETRDVEKHLFNKTRLDRLSLPFRLLFCSRLALRSPPPSTTKPTPNKTPSKPRATDGSHPIHCGDLWSLIAGKWTRGLGWMPGCDPTPPARTHTHIYSLQLLNYFHQITRRKGLGVGFDGGAKQGWRRRPGSWQSCLRHFQGCHLGWVEAL